MEIKKFFEGTDIELKNNDIKANRRQVQKLYDVPRQTLIDNVNALKIDGLVKGTKYRTLSGQVQEVYNLDETISIGFRLRSRIAIKFQRWARSILSERLRKQQIELDFFWNESDKKDLYR